MTFQWKELIFLPNLLSLSRLMLSFVIPLLWIRESSPKLIYSLIVFGALSDTLDGNLARILKLKSNLGKILDPLADKCFINMLFFLFYYENVIPLSLFIVILGRDIAILFGALYLLYLTKGRILPKPSIIGKASTVVQLITLMLLFSHTYLLSMSDLVVRVILNLTFIFALVSGLYYLLVLRRLLSDV